MKYLLPLLLSVSLSVALVFFDHCFTDTNHVFTSEIYQTISNRTNYSNVVSPFSIQALMAFVLSGAHGKTAEEIRQTLNFVMSNNQNKLDSDLRSVIRNFKNGRLFDLYLANKIYVRRNISLKNNFKNVATKLYGADVGSIDFSKKVKARKTINKWVEERTKSKVKNVMRPKRLNRLTRAVLVSGLYFKANWVVPFKKIKKGSFQAKSRVAKVDFLHHENKIFNYYKCPQGGEQILELPLRDGGQVYIIFPESKDGLKKLEQHARSHYFSAPTLQPTRLNVALPKFEINIWINLKVYLMKLGVKQLFKKNEAELEDIGKDLYLNEAFQRTYVRVNEHGIDGDRQEPEDDGDSMPDGFDGEEPFNLTINHPFIFLVRVDNVFIIAGKFIGPRA